MCHILVSASYMPGTVRGKSKGDQAEPSGTGIRQGVDIKSTKLCHTPYAPIAESLQGRKNALVLIGKLNFRTQRILEGADFPKSPSSPAQGVQVPLQSHLTKISKCHPGTTTLPAFAAESCHVTRLPLMSALFMTHCVHFRKKGSRE